MSIAQIEQNVKQVLLTSKQDTFIYDLLLAYGKPKASINRLQTPGSSGYNLSKQAGVVLWKSHVYFIATEPDNCDEVLERAKAADEVAKHKPRFIIATDFIELAAFDAKTGDTLKIPFVSLSSHFDFFLPWAGMEKATQRSDSPADVKAAEKMAKLYDLILLDNPTLYGEDSHRLNVFLSRVLFCYFAEDTEIFAEKLFSNSIQSHTAKDGSDLKAYLQELFRVLNTENRESAPAYLKGFPYVNGGLFAEEHEVPEFSKRSRDLMIQCGLDLDWSEISPDIFGSMFQAVVDVDQRGNMGMHYTSEANIMKVIEPLFLSELYEELEKARSSAKKLQDLQRRITKIKVFDPACGSGNFLIIAYKELRKLEMEILNQLSLLNKQNDFGLTALQLNQFYGVELDDFAHEIAILSMWLAEHQMNLAFMKKFGIATSLLPLKPSGNIKCGNAIQEDWREMCPAESGDEVYILGNPPYLGSKKQDAQQKADIAMTFAGSTNYKNLDYIACWFLLAARYIGATQARSGFVTTNSIVQGDQVALLWPRIYECGVGIAFSVEAFKWGNNAKNAAGVTCVVIGLARADMPTKWMYQQGHRVKVNNISPYLTDANDVIVEKRNSPIASLPEMVVGNMSLEGGFLKLDRDEKRDFVASYPEAERFLKRLTGGNEFLYGEENWCIWIEDDELDEALAIPGIRQRVDAVKAFRVKGGDVARTLVHRSHQFRYRKVASSDMILVPCTTSERREYLQVGMLPNGSIPLHSAQVVYNGSLPIFAMLSTRMHLLWTKATCGTLDSRVRYSNVIAYNNFPMPKLSQAVATRLSEHALTILSEREAHSELTIADMYDPEKMPASLKSAHERLDRDFEAAYQRNGFQSDPERLSFLFAAYEKQLKATHD